jgi:hypothetical protein
VSVRAGCTFEGYKDSGLRGAKVEISAKGKKRDTHEDITGQEWNSPNNTKNVLNKYYAKYLKNQILSEFC